MNKHLAPKTETKIRKFSQFIDRPISVLVVLLLFIFFIGWQITSNQDKNRQALEEVHISAENSERIIREQQRVIDELRHDGKERDDKQNRLLTCLLVIHGSEQAISAEAEQDCRDEANGIIHDLETQSQQQSDNQPRQEDRDADASAEESTTNTNKPNQPQEPQQPQAEPPQSILPLLDEPLVGCVRGICL